MPRGDVDEFIAELQDQSATFDPIQEDRPVNASDCVRLDYAGTLDGNEIESETGQDVDIDLTDKGYHTELINGIIGMHIGETKSIAVNFNDTYPTPELKNKQVIYNITLHAITKNIYPNLMMNLQKTSVMKPITNCTGSSGTIWWKMHEYYRTKNKKLRYLSMLIEKTNITIPDDVVDQYVQNAIENVRKQLKKIIRHLNRLASILKHCQQKCEKM